MDYPRVATQGHFVVPFFDNGPTLRMVGEVHKYVRALQWRGCEVERLRLDGFGGLIQVAGPGDLQAEFQEGDYAGVQWGRVRVIWRRPVVPAEEGDA